MVFSFSVTREAVLGCHLNKGGMLGSNVPGLVDRTQRRVLAPAKSEGVTRGGSALVAIKPLPI
jgi:hypothetical protein